MIKEISPAGSFKGYTFEKYLLTSADDYKNLGTTTVTVATALYAAFGWSPLLLVAPACGLIGAVFHCVTSAVEFRQKEVNLRK